MFNEIQVERDGNVCREKVVNLRDRLSEATQQMNAMAGEYAAVKVRLLDLLISPSTSPFMIFYTKFNKLKKNNRMFQDSSQRQSELADHLTEENAKLQIKIEDYLKDKQKREVQLEKIEMEVSLYIISKYVETDGI